MQAENALQQSVNGNSLHAQQRDSKFEPSLGAMHSDRHAVLQRYSTNRGPLLRFKLSIRIEIFIMTKMRMTDEDEHLFEGGEDQNEIE